VATLISNKQKCYFFLFLFFSSTKSENRRVEQVLPGREGTSGLGEDIRKGYRRVNMMQISCIMYGNGKMRPVETGEWGRGIKENDGGMNSNMIYCKNFCKCHNVLPVQQ
jgi:hypothetical protein